MPVWAHLYNHERQHSALNYLCAIEYYPGDSEARPAERECKLQWAAEERKTWWDEWLAEGEHARTLTS